MMKVIIDSSIFATRHHFSVEKDLFMLTSAADVKDSHRRQQFCSARVSSLSSIRSIRNDDGDDGVERNKVPYHIIST